MKYFAMLCLLSSILFSDDIILGETRLGFEFTPISSKGYTAPYNLKFKQKANLDGNKITLKVFNRHYVLDNGSEYDRLKIWPIVETNYNIFYEGMYDYYSGDKDTKKYKDIIGLFKKFDNFNVKIGYVWAEKNKYTIITSGNLFKIGKHKLGFENYNYRDVKTNNYELNLELQYKYKITKNVDLYAYCKFL